MAWHGIDESGMTASMQHHHGEEQISERHLIAMKIRKKISGMAAAKMA